MTTIIYNCKKCKIGKRVDYPLGSWSKGTYARIDSNGRTVQGGIVIACIGGGRPTVYQGDLEFGLCPTCHHAMKYGVLDGTVVEGHVCDARCTSARGPSCDCSCGGKNHGSAW